MPQTDPLADLRARFIARSRERVQSLRILIDAAPAQHARHDAGTEETSTAAAIARLAHQLAGAAGTFGYVALGQAAATLEDRARAAEGEASTFDPLPLTPMLQALEGRMAELETSAVRDPA
jgi:HPt (histidine-containing phosphotransfer) domain-containing protein